MSVKVAKGCAICGPIMIVLFLIGFLGIARFVPPPSPNLTAAQTLQMYVDRQFPIRLGLWIATLGAAFMGPYFAVISAQMRRIEGPLSSPLAMTQVSLGALAIFEFILPQQIWEAAAYRADRAPDSVQALTDVGWLCFIGITATFLIQLSAIGVAILTDQRARPLMPRWVGYFTIWIALMIMPGSLCVFFHDGPFIWSGVFGFWVPLVAFSGWFPVMTWAVWKAIDTPEPATEPAAPTTGEVELNAEVRAELAELRAAVATLRPGTLAG